MLKVVVFDGGWGGKVVADVLSEEINTIEVVRVMDWQDVPYDRFSLAELQRLTIQHLEPYIGKADLIVLGGYVVSLATDELKRRYPKQKFVGMGLNYHLILRARNYPSQVAILVDSILIESAVCEEIRQNLPHSTIIIPDCSGWEERIDHGEMSRALLEYELCDYFHTQPLPAASRRLAKPTSALPLIEVLRRERAVAAAQAKLPAKPQDVAPDGLTKRPAPAPSSGAPKAFTEKIRPDVVLILNTHFWTIRPELESLFGYRVRILDFRQKLLHDICIALGLRGVDGRRPK